MRAMSRISLEPNMQMTRRPARKFWLVACIHLLLVPVECRADDAQDRELASREEAIVLQDEWREERDGAIATTSTWSRGQAKRGLEDGAAVLDVMGVGDVVTNRCSDLDMSIFDKGTTCGAPLSMPCFDYSRCQLDAESDNSTIYVYDSDCSLDPTHMLEISSTTRGHNPSPILRYVAREMGVLADTYESACLFVDVNDKAGRRPCGPSSPLWNDGANHLMIDTTDSSRCVLLSE